jgi:hypothetical protein
MSQNIIARTPTFKYTTNKFNKKRKEWISTMYPFSTHFLDILKRIPWTDLGFTYCIFGGAAYEVYNMTYAKITEADGYNLHTYVDPTSDIDVNVTYLDPEINKLKPEDISEIISNLYSAIADELEAVPYFTKYLNTPDYSESNKQENEFGPFLLSDQIGPFILGIYQDDKTRSVSYRIRVNYKIGVDIDHNMEFLIDTGISSMQLVLNTGLIVRDLYYELYRNIALIDEWFDELLINRTESTVKVLNHIHRFTYGFRLLNTLYKNKDPILNTLPVAYVDHCLLNILTNVIEVIIKYTHLETEPEPNPIIPIETIVIPIIKCPSSTFLHSHILHTLQGTVSSIKMLIQEDPGDKFYHLSLYLPIANEFIESLTHVSSCTYGTISTGGKRSRKQNRTHKKRAKKN